MRRSYLIGATYGFTLAAIVFGAHALLGEPALTQRIVGLLTASLGLACTLYLSRKPPP